MPPSRPSPVSEEEGGIEEEIEKPYFVNSTDMKVVGGVGRTAFLHCRVEQLGNRAVMWIRKRDLHVLTVGLFTYSTDARFSALHSEGSDTWTLRIASAQLTDTGAYECQVTIEPKMSQEFTLHIVEASARLTGPREIHMVSGSNINLTCHVSGSPEPPQQILWYRGTTLVNYSSRGGISVVTDKLTGTSRLVLTRTTSADSGNYTCVPANAEPASVSVYILNGEHPAAIQGGSDRNLQTLPGLLLLAGAVSGLHNLTQR
ncbi:hypothetical protein O3P69_014632 [Scylla paramamosain]|uniref:Ig-like domain-containing protein n=1 Tax=Scylla paramamosain TaxID=85552 RepID=A0AAW0TYS0_SCYPA